MKKWIFRGEGDNSPPDSWADDLCISPVLLRILWNRGFIQKDKIERFLNAPLKNLTPPNKWPMIPEAASLLASELLAGKKLAIWGDYDVDGITATALALDVLEFHGFTPLHHLPDRRQEGYGLNESFVEKLAAQGCQTLLTVDCGISDVDVITRANELGLTVIVSDHHLPPQILPPAKAIVNPRLTGDWPSANLAGVGVAFYLMAAVNALLAPHTGKRYRMDEALDITALGTLADVMKLEGENRILTRGGLAAMTKPVRPGMAALKVASGFDLAATLDSSQAVFRLAPRLNAAGRMGSPQLALNLLRAKDYSSAIILAEELNECNQRRKTEESRIHTQARNQANELLERRDYSALALFGEDWHPGILGIVASRIVEEFTRPAIVLCGENDILKGSGRSLPDFDLHAGLEKTACWLEGFGGHSQAAGVSLKMENLDNFRQAFSDVVKAELGPRPPLPSLCLDGELPFEYAAKPQFLRELEMLEPFGAGNPEPVFASLPLVLRSRRLLGRSGDHVLLELEEKESGRALRAKAWRMASEFPESLVGREIRIAYTPRLDNYNGIASIDLGIKDWQKI